MKVRNGEIALPRFQREEAWDNRTRQDFLTSVVRGLPVGVALILGASEEPHFVPRFLPGAPEGENAVHEQLLDGQQRLTTLWKAFTDSFDGRTYLIDLDDRDEPSVVGEKRYKKGGNDKLYPLWVDDPEGCWDRNKIPVDLLNPDESSPGEVREWCRLATENEEEYNDVFDTIIKFERNISQFNIPYLYLPPSTEAHVAIDVFIKMNTSFVQLSTFDIIVAQTEDETGESLHQKRDQLRRGCLDLSNYIDIERYILRATALRQEKMTSNQGYFDLDLPKMIEKWDDLIGATENLIPFLQQERIYDGERIPTNLVMAPLAALFTDLPSDPADRGNAKRLLKKYMWRGFFTNRYERSTATRIFEDFQSLKQVISGGLSENEVPIFDEEEHPLPTIEELKQARWPTYKDRIARGILAVSFKPGARNFADDDEVSKNNITDREYHHLYPRAFLKDRGFTEKEADKALNCALINWADNRDIGAKSPLQYLIERSDASDLGESQIRKRLDSHLIEYEDMVSEDYDQFIDSRARQIRNCIVNLCNGRDYNA